MRDTQVVSMYDQQFGVFGITQPFLNCLLLSEGSAAADQKKK
jgi:hypothetical protein